MCAAEVNHSPLIGSQQRQQKEQAGPGMARRLQVVALLGHAFTPLAASRLFPAKPKTTLLFRAPIQDSAGPGFVGALPDRANGQCYGCRSGTDRGSAASAGSGRG